MVNHYTFNVTCSFDMQFTFTERDVEQDSEGNTDDFVPTEEAMLQLEVELREHLEQKFGAANVEVYTDSDALLGVVDDADE